MELRPDTVWLRLLSLDVRDLDQGGGRVSFRYSADSYGGAFVGDCVLAIETPGRMADALYAILTERVLSLVGMSPGAPVLSNLDEIAPTLLPFLRSFERVLLAEKGGDHASLDIVCSDGIDFVSPRMSLWRKSVDERLEILETRAASHLYYGSVDDCLSSVKKMHVLDPGNPRALLLSERCRQRRT